jgi:inositol-polyphosphate multikinase
VTKEYGKSLKVSELPDAMRKFFPLTPSQSDSPEGVGLPKSLLVPVLSGLIGEIQQIRDALDQMEFRMVNASLLVVYESDWDAARTFLAKDAERKERGKELKKDEDDEGDEEEDEESDEEDEDEQEKLFAVKLIDFAHTKLTPGRGKDEGVILGLDTTLRLLSGRLKEIQ